MRNPNVSLCCLLAALALGLPGCRHAQTSSSEAPSDVVSALPMYDAHASRQLLSGFYNLENGSWRWAGPKFAVELQPPAQSATRGARLVLRVVVTEDMIHQLNTLTLAAKVGDTSLPPETYNHAGDFAYTRDVPASALQANAVHIDFWLDKSLPPVANDRRQLGIVVSHVALEPK